MGCAVLIESSIESQRASHCSIAIVKDGRRLTQTKSSRQLRPAIASTIRLSDFDLLQDRLSRAGAISRHDIGFFLRGPMGHPVDPERLRFCREAPRIGLTGITDVVVGEHGVIAEKVTYDLNLASDILCRAMQ